MLYSTIVGDYMEHNRRHKIFIIFALVLSIISVSVGFAAFSATLNISSTASVSPNSDSFSVALSSSSTIYATEEVDVAYKSDGVTTSKATIVNGTGVVSVSNIRVGFTTPGQTALYALALTNNGEYRAYLNSVVFEPKTCNYNDDINSELAQAACEAIDVTLAISHSYGVYAYDANDTEYEYFYLEPGETYGFDLNFNYDNNNWIDGDLNVIFGDIKLYFSSVEEEIDLSKSYAMGDSVMYDPVNDTACTSGDTCYEWNVIEQSDASSNDVTLITTNVLNSVYYDYALGANETSAITARNNQMFLATSDWEVLSRHLISDEYRAIVDYYGCSWPEGLGMSCADGTYDAVHWFYSNKYFYLDGNMWVGYDGGFNGDIHYYDSNMAYLSIGVRPVITISKDKLV